MKLMQHEFRLNSHKKLSLIGETEDEGRLLDMVFSTGKVVVERVAGSTEIILVAVGEDYSPPKESFWKRLIAIFK